MNGESNRYMIERNIFDLIVKRVREKRDSLEGLKRFQRMGIEGWFKVESIAALGEEQIAYIQNKGPDIKLRNNLEIELKAATDFNPRYIKDGAIKYQTMCLFLGDGNTQESIDRLVNDNDIEVIGIDTFQLVDGDKWVVGLIKPSEE